MREVLLLDLRLPKVDGLDVLHDIKSDVELKGIPVVVMTASTDEQDRLKCDHANVDTYLHKPVDVDKFMHAIDQLRDFWSQEELILPV